MRVIDSDKAAAKSIAARILGLIAFYKYAVNGPASAVYLSRLSPLLAQSTTIYPLVLVPERSYIIPTPTCCPSPVNLTRPLAG